MFDKEKMNMMVLVFSQLQFSSAMNVLEASGGYIQYEVF